MAYKKRSQKKKTYRFAFLYHLLFFTLSCGAVLSVYHFVWASNDDLAVIMELDPNIGLEQRVEEFFMANNAPEMIPIIRCESQFRHYNNAGEVLTNTQGSSATGIAQILSSTHPDPKVVKVYNRRFNTALSVDDFDITTIEGNLGYALMLYKVRGIRDWECAKKFSFL